MRYTDLVRFHSALVELLAARDSVEADVAEHTNTSIQRLLDGADRAALRMELDAGFEPGLARRIFEAATGKYAAAQEAGTLHELQHDIYFAKRPSRARHELAAAGCIGAGLLLIAISYYFAVPHKTYTISAGAIAYGGWLLIKS